MKDHWPNRRLGDLFEIARGGSPRPIEAFITDAPDGLNWVKISDASASGKFIYSTSEKIKLEGLSKTRLVNPGDFLLTNSMSFGRPYIMATKGCIHDGWLVLKPSREGIVDQDYFYHLLGSEPLYQRLAARASGSTVKNLNTEIVSSIELPLPPLDEQRRIATILDKTDTLRRKRKRALDLLNSLSESVFLEMFGDPIENPNRFPVLHLEDIVSQKRRITYGILKPGPNCLDGIPYVRVLDIQNSRINVRGLNRTSKEIATSYNRSVLKAGDLLISIRGHVGRMAITPQECEGANITQDTARLAIEGADTEFVKSLLETNPSRRWMQQRTKGAAVKGINLGDLKAFPVIVPPPATQAKFAAVVRRLRVLTDKSAHQRATLDALFSSLQHRAFSGQL